MAFCRRVIFFFFSSTNSYLGHHDDLPTECSLLHPSPDTWTKALYLALFCAVLLSIGYQVSSSFITWFIGRDSEAHRIRVSDDLGRAPLSSDAKPVGKRGVQSVMALCALEHTLSLAVLAFVPAAHSELSFREN